MASSGEYETSRAAAAGDYSRPASLIFRWELVSQSGRTKTINYWFKVGGASSTINWYYGSRGNCTINGQRVYSGGTGEIADHRYTKWKIIHSGQINIDSDRLEVFLEGRFYAHGPNGYVSGSQSWDLPSSGGGESGGKINASRFTVSPATVDIPIGGGLSVDINRDNSSLSHTVFVTQDINGMDYLIKKENIGTSCYIGNSELQSKLLNLIPSGGQKTLWVVVWTLNNGEYVGSRYAGITVRHRNPDPPRPAIFTYKDAAEDIVEITGSNNVVVEGFSDLLISITQHGSASSGAHVSKYICSAGGVEKTVQYSSGNIDIAMGKVSGSGEKTIALTTVDSKGATATSSKNMMVIPYSAPEVFATAERAGSTDNSVILRILSKFSPIKVDGEAKNSVSLTEGVKYRYKLASSENWEEWKIRPAVNPSDGVIKTAPLAIQLLVDQEYDFEVMVSDKFKTSLSAFKTTFGTPRLFIGTDSRISIGGMPTKEKAVGEQGLLEVHGPIYSNGKKVMVEDDSGGQSTVNCPYDIGDVYITINPAYATAEAVASKWKGTRWERYSQGKTIFGYDPNQSEFNFVGKTGGAKSVALSSAQMPRHSHNISYESPNGDGVTISCTENGHRVLNVENWAWRKNSNGASNGSNLHTTYAGDGLPHENLPPYTVSYMWVRVE